MNNSEYMDAAGEIARMAGCLIRDSVEAEHRVQSKAGRHDLVTEVDGAAEQLIRGEIARRFPGHKFHGEESAGAGDALASLGRDEFVWIVDPLDGTTNFVRRLPLFCVSIALARGGEILAGAIFDPSRDELFAAARDGGAFLNSGPMHVSGVENLADAVVSGNLPLSTHPLRPTACRIFSRMLPELNGMRGFGCAALALASVAAGRTDGHWEYGLNIWDIAAGALLIREAGGLVDAADGKGFSLASRNVVAGNPVLQRTLMRQFFS